MKFMKVKDNEIVSLENVRKVWLEKWADKRFEIPYKSIIHILYTDGVEVKISFIDNENHEKGKSAFDDVYNKLK